MSQYRGDFMWQGYNNYDHYFNISQLDDFFKEISSINIPIMANRRKEVINVPATLDNGGCYFFSGFDGSVITLLLSEWSITGATIQNSVE